MIDYFIVGQGLAGSLLAWTLQQQGLHVHLIDNQHKTSSSKMAAGLMNPVTGMRLVKQPNITKTYEAAINQYQSLGQFFSTTFYHALPMRRFILSEKQQAYYEKRRADRDYDDFIGDYTELSAAAGYQISQTAFKQMQTGYLDMPLLLTHLGRYFHAFGGLQQTECDAGEFDFSQEWVSWQGRQAKGVIFCEGYKGSDNPWFDLPFQPSKGEILTLSMPHHQIDCILNAGIWLLPLATGGFRLGATNDWHTINNHITPTAKLALLEKLARICRLDSQVTVQQQLAGVRPATLDKQPFIGVSKQQKRAFMFNGFGAHGSMKIPYYAELFSQYLLLGKPLPNEVNTLRF